MIYAVFEIIPRFKDRTQFLRALVSFCKEKACLVDLFSTLLQCHKISPQTGIVGLVGLSSICPVQQRALPLSWTAYIYLSGGATSMLCIAFDTAFGARVSGTVWTFAYRRRRYFESWGWGWGWDRSSRRQKLRTLDALERLVVLSSNMGSLLDDELDESYTTSVGPSATTPSTSTCLEC
jgi:hypothetical protein